MLNKLNIPKIILTLEKILYVLLIINIFCWPTLSNRTYLLARIISNVAEYGLIFFSFVYFLLNYKSFRYFPRYLFALLFFIFTLAITSIFTSVINFNFLITIAKYFNGFSLLVVSFIIEKNKKRKNIVYVSIILSFGCLVISSVYMVAPNFNLLKEAFTGGVYRLGNTEYQANGYASYCIFACIIFIDYYLRKKKKWILLLVLIPILICFGTQSKKGILVCFALATYAFYLFVGGFKTTKGKVALASYCCAFIGILVFLTLKTNLLARLLNFNNLSTTERTAMIIFSVNGIVSTPLFGNGINNFSHFFYLNYGYSIIMHSTIFDILFSGGLISLCLWISFIYFLYKNSSPVNKINRAFFIIIQIILDLTAQIWFMPLNFIMLGFFFGDETGRVVSEYNYKNINI